MLRNSLRASTSSPTRSRIEATRPTSTRIEFSAAERTAEACSTGRSPGEATGTGGVTAGSASTTGGAATTVAASLFAGVPAPDSPTATAVSDCASSRKSCSPSAPVASIDRRIDRTASTIEYSDPVTRSSRESLPSRSLPSRCSPLCVRAPSFENPKNPLFPLIVWTVRKMLASRSSSPGTCSKAMRSRSSWSRFSVDSTRNSWTNSSLSLFPGMGSTRFRRVRPIGPVAATLLRTPGPSTLPHKIVTCRPPTPPVLGPAGTSVGSPVPRV